MKRLYPVRSCALLAALLLLPYCLTAQLTWTPANVGLEGGVIHSLHPTPGGSMLASTTLGLHRLDQTSSSWISVIDLFGSRWQVASDSAGTLYATSHLAEFSTAYISTDDGRTWTSPLDTGDVYSLVGDDVDVLLLGKRGRSIDGGVTWTATDTVYFDFIASAARGRFAAMTYGQQIVTSTDGGNTWSFGGSVPAYPATALAAIDDRVFVVARDTLLVTTDGGMSWSRALDVPVRSIARIGDGGLIVSSQGTDRRRATDGMYRSDDTGRTWRQIATGYFQELAATADGSIFAESAPGVSRSTDDGTTWQPINIGLEERTVETWAVPDGTIYGLAHRMDLQSEDGPGVRDLYRSSDNAASWQLALDRVHQTWTFFGGRGIATTNYSVKGPDPWKTRDSAVVSLDNGRTWTTLSAGSVLAVASSGESIAAVSMRDFKNPSRPNLYVTTDGGTTWTARTTPTRHDRMAITASGTIVVDMRQGLMTMAASTDFGVTWRTLLERNWVQGVMAPGGETIVAVTYDASDTTYIIERSDDGGATFTSTKTRDTYIAVMRQVGGMTVIPMLDQSGTNVWRSSDSGATWISSPIGWLRNGVFRPTVAPTGELFALHIDGIIRSTNYGATWHAIDTSRWLGMPTSNGRVLVASHAYGGVYRTSQLSGVERDEASSRPNSLVVRPNPATDRLIVEARGAGTLTVVDMSGRQVRRMTVDGSTDSAVLDISGLAAGVYVVRLVSATGTSTAQLVVVGQ